MPIESPAGSSYQREYKRTQQKFVCLGVDLNNPANLMPPGKYPLLQNVRSYQEGRIESRIGTTKINTGGALADLNIHTIHRMNDYVNTLFIRFLGAGTNLYRATTSQTLFTQTDTGYSGDPMSIVPYRPDQSAVVWAYIADRLRMRKVKSDGTNYAMGVAPPNVPPTVELLQPQYGTPSITDNVGGWTVQGAANTLANLTRLTGVTIQGILYNSGNTGWCCIAPTGTDAAKLTPGMRVWFQTNQEIAIVEEIHYVSNASLGVTISQIVYDSGTTGLCTIQPSITLKGLERNTMLQLGGTTEYVRVLSVTNAADGTASFRCSTVNNHGVGNVITAPANGNLWLYTTTTRLANDTITAQGLTFNVTATAGAGQGTLAANFGGIGSPNFATVNTASGRPVGPDDYIHLGVKIDNPQNIVECQLILDVDPATGGSYAANDGNGNAYYKSFRPSDFQPVVAGTQTTDASRTQAIQLQQQNLTPNLPITTPRRPHASFGTGEDSVPIDARKNTPTPLKSQTQTPAAQLGAGMSQFTEFKFKVAEFTRIGSYLSADLSIIRAIQLRVTVTGNATISIADLWVGGTYGPDTGTNLTPFIYRYRYRSSATGAKSLPGPELRSGIVAQRQGILVTCTASTDPQVDKIDIERLGGVEPNWHYVGTAQNSSPTFTDDQFTAAILVNPPLEVDAFQPFPLVDIPRSSVVNVSGTAVTWISGDTFNTSWARGMLIRLAGKVTTLYAPPINGNTLHVTDSMPSGVNITMEIPEPVLMGQPLPVMWGPYYDTFFACGNTLDPGSVYFTKAFDPDSAPDTNRIEVTSPSETMMNGVMYDGRCYAFSDKRMFSVIPSSSYAARMEGGANISAFNFTEVRNGKGLYTKWALTVGSKIWFIAADGIYETDGGEPTMISTDIRPLFPQGDNVGVVVNGFYPIDMTKSLRLCAHQSYLFFDYVDTNGVSRTLVYDTQTKAWFPDVYPYGFICHYSEFGLLSGLEVKTLLGGGNNGFLYSHTGALDDTAAVAASVWTPAVDFGETRAKKLYGDIVFDLDAQADSITATPSLDNYTNDLTTTTFNSAVGALVGQTRQITTPIDLGSGLGVFARNLGVKFTWNATGRTYAGFTPALYYWEPSYLERPEDTFARADDWNDGGYKGSKLVRGFLVEVDTFGVSRTFKLQGDQTDLQNYAIIGAGQKTIAFPVNPPAVASLMRLVPTDSNSWRKFEVSYIFEEYPELAAMATPYSDDGYQGAKFVQGLIAEATSLGVAVPATVQYDGDQNGPAITMTHSGPTLSSQPYSFATPIIAHQLRVNPTLAIRLGKMKWVWEPAPELAANWITQGTAHDIPGWQFLRDGYIAHISTQDITLSVTVDGRVYKFTVGNGAGVYTRSYVVFGDGSGNSLKGKLFTYSLTSGAPFRLFVKDSEVRVHPWIGGGYTIKRPFGDQSRVAGAKI